MTVTLNKRWIGTLVLFQISLVIAAFTGGMLTDRWITSSQTQFPLLQEAFGILENHALLDLPPQTKLEYAMIQGLVSAFDDPHTSFVEPPQHELQSDQLAGHYGGVGTLLEVDSDGLFFLHPEPDSPAYEAGVRDGDQLLSINGWEITLEATRDEVEAALRGKDGEKVDLVIFRNSTNEQMTITIRRVNIEIPSISWDLTEDDQTVGIIHVKVIANTTPDEITKAIRDLQLRGANSFILDLRNNSGGLVEAGVNTARLFLSEGTVIEQQYRDQPVKAFAVDRAGAFKDLPLVVLVNSGTASSAEIVAGALQAQKRAPLIGSYTYGKFTIQMVFDLSDKSSLHVTAARWWVPGLTERPAGYPLEPDILFPDDQAFSPAIMHEAINYLVQ
jgi:carboxyl-terminal processing protease